MRALSIAATHVFLIAALARAQAGAAPATEPPDAAQPPDATAPAAGPQPAAPPPSAQAPGPSDAELKAWLAPQRDPLGRRCELADIVPVGDLRYLACGASGVWIARVSPNAAPALVGRMDVSGDVRALSLRDGYVWAEITTVSARRLFALAGRDTAPAVAPTEPPKPPASSPPANVAAARVSAIRARLLAARSIALRNEGEVIRRGADHVIVNLGTEQGVEEGAHIAFYSVTHDGPAEDELSARRELLAVGRVERVIEDQSRVVLGLDERAPIGAMASLTERALSASASAPPRLGGLWDVGFVARPFLIMDTLGAGVFGDAHVGYGDQIGLRYEAALAPVAFASAKAGSTSPIGAFFSTSYDTRLFEIGLGLGGQSVNSTDFGLDPGSGLSLVQRLRLGARDGLYLQGLSYVTLFHSQFRFSDLRVQAQIPLSDRYWLLAGGGGGRIGLAYGELGLRVLLAGNGDRGSFFLNTVLGGVEVFKSAPPCLDPFGPCDTSEIDYAGPMIGAGGEWRL